MHFAAWSRGPGVMDLNRQLTAAALRGALPLVGRRFRERLFLMCRNQTWGFPLRTSSFSLQAGIDVAWSSLRGRSAQRGEHFRRIEPSV